MKSSKNTYITFEGRKFTIKEKNKRWHIAFYFNGKRINKSTGLKATKENFLTVKKEILAQVAEELNHLEQKNISNDINDDQMLFQNFSEEYFLIHKGEVRVHVFDKNYKNFLNHVLPYFKGKLLSDIKPIHIESWQQRLLSKYKISSVKKFRSILYGILEKSFQNDYIKSNPMKKVPLRNTKKVTYSNVKCNPKMYQYAVQKCTTL